MKRTKLSASMLCVASIFAASVVSAQNLPVDLAGNISGMTPSVRLTKLINSTLKSQSGETLGQVQDLIVDPVTGQVQFAVLSTGADGTATTSGIGATSETTATATGGQFVAVPWQLVSSSGPGQFTARVDRTKLQSAPTFSGSAWPTIDAAWIQSVNSYYGLSPIGVGRPGSNSGTGTGVGYPSSPSSLNRPGTREIPRVNSPYGVPSSGTGTSRGPSRTSSGGSGSGGGK